MNNLKNEVIEAIEEIKKLAKREELKEQELETLLIASLLEEEA
jgi:hypothetical protein